MLCLDVDEKVGVRYGGTRPPGGRMLVVLVMEDVFEL